MSLTLLKVNNMLNVIIVHLKQVPALGSQRCIRTLSDIYDGACYEYVKSPIVDVWQGPEYGSVI